MNLNVMVEAEIMNGYGDANAQSKVCQDIVLKAISSSSLSRNMTIKGGVVMRSKTHNIRRATQDMDIDFIKYSISEEAIDLFISKLNCIDSISIKRYGEIRELKQQDYHGKRVLIEVSDKYGNKIVSKLDLGVHTHLDIDQEEYCFDIGFDDNGASVLINSNEQMFTEKLRSLLRFGSISTRYKDIYDMYYLCGKMDLFKLGECIESFIFSDELMRENTVEDIIHRVKIVFSNKTYIQRIEHSKHRWLEDDMDVITSEIIRVLEQVNTY